MDDETIQPRKNLRELLECAASALEVYRNPDLSELRDCLLPVMEAAAMGALRHEEITRIREYTGGG